jgi:hypothetical protein
MLQNKVIKPKLIPKIIGTLLLILAALLPIQNLLVVFAVNILSLPNWLALWKELVIVALIICMTTDLVKNIGFKNIKYKWFLGIFAALNLLVVVSSFVINKVPFTQFIAGYRFELFWLWLWVIGFVWIQNLLISKSQVEEGLSLHNSNIQFYKQQLIKGVFLGFGLCLIFALGQLTVGKDFVQFFGYTDSSLEIVKGKINSPICHSIDFGVEPCRLAAPFSSPNHLDGYLIFILGFALFYAIKRGELASLGKAFAKARLWRFDLVNLFHGTITAFTNFSFLPISVIISVLTLLTYSRFALIVLVLYWLFALIYLFKKSFSKYLTIAILLFTFTFSLLITSTDPTWATKILPAFLAKPSSSLEHYRLTGVSLDILKLEPLILIGGLGQGASGSSTTYFQPDQNVIYKRFKDISYKWFIKPERISVPENWYLQLVLNGGLIYLALYLFILIYPIAKLMEGQKPWWSNSPLEGWQAKPDGVFKSDELQNPPDRIFRYAQNNEFLKNQSYQNLFVFIAFFGIILGNIFLHLWENQTIAIYWSLIYLWWSLENENFKILNPVDN